MNIHTNEFLFSFYLSFSVILIPVLNYSFPSPKCSFFPPKQISILLLYNLTLFNFLFYYDYFIYYFAYKPVRGKHTEQGYRRKSLTKKIHSYIPTHVKNFSPDITLHTYLPTYVNK